MNGLVACTVKLAATDVSCIIRIFLNRSQKSTPPFPEWGLIGGTLFERFAYGQTSYGQMGRWEYFEGRLTLIGIIPGYAEPYMPVGPVVSFEAPLNPFTVAELNEVPDNFLEIVTPRNTVRGTGKLGVNNEILNWSMWYRTK